MKYATAFRDGAAGQVPDGWTRRWAMVEAIGSTPHDISPVIHQTHLDEEPSLLWRTSNFASTGYGALTMDAIDADADRDDVEILATVSLNASSSAADTQPVLVVRQSGATSSEAGYVLELNVEAQEISISKLVAGARTQLDVAAAAMVYENRVLRVRFQVLGSAGTATQKGKVWTDGDAEPAGWDVESTDTAISAAGGVGFASQDAPMRWATFFSVGTGGSTPDTPEQFGPSLAELCRDRDAIFEYTLEMEGRDIGTDVVAAEYHSTHGRDTTAQDLPASSSFTALLEVPQSITKVLAGDFDHGQEIGQLASLSLKNQPRNVGEAGPLDHWLDGKTFEGRKAILRVGQPGATHRSFTRLLTGTVRGEPEVGADQATVTLESPLGLALRRPLDVRRYIGIRTGIRALVASRGFVTQAHVAAYDLTSFTLVARYRHPSGSATAVAITRKQVTGTNRNWELAIQSGGNVTCRWSESGVNTLIHDTGAVLYNDGELHTYVWAAAGGVRSYLMVDGEVVAEDLSIGTPDVQTAAVGWGLAMPVGSEQFDGRLYGVYLSPDLARGLASQRAEGDSHPDLVSLLQMDDGAGTTAADQSPTNNDGAVDGTENTHFEWFATDQGDAAFAGRPMPALYGEPYNVPTDPIDKPRERYRINDGDLTTIPSTDWDPARSQGVERILNTDYTDEGDGVIEFGSAQSEPVTADVLYVSGDTSALYAPQMAVNILIERGGFPTSFQSGVIVNSEGIDHDAARALLNSRIYRAGWHSKGATPSMASILTELLTPIVGHYRDDRWGRIVLDTLRPPMGPGPYGKWIEFSAIPTNHNRGSLEWYGLTIPSGSRTMAFWLRNYAAVVDSLASESITGLANSFAVGPGTLSVGVEDARISFNVTGLSGGVSSPNPAPIGRNMFIAGTYNSGDGALKLYVGFEGEALNLVASATVTGTAAAGTSMAASGVGAMAGLQAWDSALNLAALEVQFEATTPPTGNESGIVAVAPLTEGTGSTAQELVSGTYAPLRGCRWCPKMALDLTAGNTIVSWSKALRQLRPASRITVRHNRNWRPLGPTEIAAGVAAADRSALLNEWESIDAFDAAVAADYLSPRELVFDTVLVRKNDAGRIVELWKDRLQGGRKFGELRLGSSKQGEHDNRALYLSQGDELRITDYRYGLDAGWHARVVGLTASPGTVAVGVWG